MLKPELRNSTEATSPSVSHMLHEKAPMPSQPYRSSPIFTADTLPEALQREHRTKRGVWALITILEGGLRYQRMNGSSATMLTPDHPGLVHPDEPHLVQLDGPVRVRIDFFDHQPVGTGLWTC